MISNYEFGGSSHDSFQGPVLVFTWRNWGGPQMNLRTENLHWDSNRLPPECDWNSL